MLDALRLTVDPADDRDANGCALRCALGNGVLFMLSAPPEEGLSGAASRLPAGYVSGRRLLPLPQVLGLGWRHDGEAEWFVPDGMATTAVTQRLLMAEGTLQREAVVEDTAGRRTAWTETRFVSLVHANLVMLRWELTPLNWAGPILVRSQVDLGMQIPPMGHWAHAVPLPQVIDVMSADGLAVRVAGGDGAPAWRVDVQLRTSGAPSRQAGRSHDSRAAYQQRHVDVPAGATVVAEVVASITEEAPGATATVAPLLPAFDQEVQRQQAAWAGLWARVQVSLPNDASLERAMRFHAFHLMQSVSPLSVGRGGGLPAWAARPASRSPAWQQALVLPFFSLRLPALARQLLNHWHGQLATRSNPAADAPSRSAAAIAAWQHHRTVRDMTLLGGAAGDLIVGAARCWALRGTGGGPLVAAWALRCAATLEGHLDPVAWQRLAERLRIAPEEPAQWYEASLRSEPEWLAPGVLAAPTEAEVDLPTLLHLLGPVQASDLLRHASVATPADWYVRTVRHHAAPAPGDLAAEAACAGALAAVDADASWARFIGALQAPAEAPGQGLPLCGMAATWDVLQRHYLGIEADLHALRLHPCPPAELDDVALRVCLAGHWAVVGLDGRDLFVHAETGGPPLTVQFGGRLHEVADGTTWSARCR